MLMKIRTNELNRLIPAVATGNQFANASGNAQKLLQRIMISSIGGVITFLILNQNPQSALSPVWLIIVVTFLLYVIWGPILEASLRNSKLKKYTYAALFEGEILNIYTKEKIINSYQQANKLGNLELVENRRTWIHLEIGDADGYIGLIKFPIKEIHSRIKPGNIIRCLVFANDKSFASKLEFSDAWLPSLDLWVGDYPYLLRPAFQEFCYLNVDKS